MWPTVVQTYIHTYIQAYIHTHIHTCIHTYIHTYLHYYIHTYIHAYMHTYIHRLGDLAVMRTCTSKDVYCRWYRWLPSCLVTLSNRRRTSFRKEVKLGKMAAEANRECPVCFAERVPLARCCLCVEPRCSWSVIGTCSHHCVEGERCHSCSNPGWLWPVLVEVGLRLRSGRRRRKLVHKARFGLPLRSGRQRLG